MAFNIRVASGLIAAGLGLFTSTVSAQIQFQDQTNTRFPQPNLNEYTNQASIVDLDDDNDLDFVLANGQGFSSQGVALRLRVFINNGTGVFTEESAARVASWTGWARGVEFGDIERDGDWDMIVAQDFNKQPQLFVNDGLGVFTNETGTRLPAMTMSSSRAQFGDVDNDGDLDLFLCNSGTSNRFGTGQPRLFLNDGLGFYTNATPTNLPSPGTITDQQDCIFGDVDGDLDLDILIVSRNAASVLWLNNGSGVFAATGFPADGSSYSMDFGDINGDGDLDLLSIEGGADKLFSNNGAGAFSNISSEISPNTAIDDNDSKFFDYDNDGDLDYIVGSLGSIERIYRNNGQVAGADFTQVTGIMTAVADSTMDIEVADLTNDGKLDILTLQGESGSFVDRIYANIGPAGVVDNQAPVIIETEDLPDGSSDGPFVVRAVIYDDYTSDRGFFDKGVFLNYAFNGGEVQQVEMDWHGNSMWRGEIPVQKGLGTVDYFVTATDWNNNLVTGPILSFEILLCADIGGNGSVDIDDLLSIINNWGPCADPDNCPADIAPPGGDDQVNVDDMLSVINTWGPCP